MKPILYESNETAFTSNGLGRLRDCISCVVTEERNGIYECDFEYPITGANYDKIRLGRIIAVEHDDTNDLQPFDIVSYSKPINGVVTFHAVHISYRQSKLTAVGTNINSLASAFTMLGSALPENPFSYETNIESTAYMASADGTPRSVRQFLGGVEGSILDTYGGEYEWDKFRVVLHKSRGAQRSLAVRYGVNMSEYNEDTDYSGTYTAVVPYWTGGDSIIVGALVESGNTSYDGHPNAIPLDLTDKFENQPTTTELEAAALSYMNSHESALPSSSVSVSFIQLENTNEYDELAPLLKCRLCDSIKVVFPHYNTSRYMKIVKTVYNVLLERYESLELGTLSTTLSEALGVSQSSGSSYSGGGGGGGGSGETYSLSISGHTITLSGDGGTTSSVTVPDNNTTYTLSISDNTLTLTPSTGAPQTVTVPDSNTTYSISISDHAITLTPSEGSAETITVPDDNTTYTLTRDGNSITLTPSSGTAQSIVATYYATCSTAAATSKKEVTVDSSFSLESGARIVVYMTNSNTVSNPTLSVNGGTAHAIRRYGTTAAGTSAAAGWNAGQMLSMTYSGSYWYIENWLNTTYSTITDAEYQAGTSTSSRLVTPARLKNAILYHAPVKSVNGQTGAVTVTVPTKTSDLTNDSGFLNSVPEADEITFSSSGHWNFFQNVTDVSQALDVVGDYIDDNLSPLVGTTATVTPQDVMTALGAGRDICITASYTYQSIPLALRFTAFNRATDTVNGQVLDYAVSQTIVIVGSDTVLFTLAGGTSQGTAVAWQVNMQVLVNDSTLGSALNGYVPTSREVNNKPLSANITLTSSDVGAISAPSSASAGDFLVYNGSAWVAQSLSTWQGGNY